MNSINCDLTLLLDTILFNSSVADSAVAKTLILPDGALLKPAGDLDENATEEEDEEEFESELGFGRGLLLRLLSADLLELSGFCFNLDEERFLGGLSAEAGAGTAGGSASESDESLMSALLPRGESWSITLDEYCSKPCRAKSIESAENRSPVAALGPRSNDGSVIPSTSNSGRNGKETAPAFAASESESESESEESDESDSDTSFALAVVSSNESQSVD